MSITLHPNHATANAVDRACHCAVCANCSRPQDVPWSQHSIGCPTRAIMLTKENKR